VGKAVKGTLRLEMKLNEDINGDAATPDNIAINIPVDLVLGKVSTANVTIRRGVRPSGPPTTNQPGSADAVFFPDAAAGQHGEVLLVELSQQDASGSQTDFYAVTPTGSAVFDTDGDRFIEAGDDTIYTDADHDGWPDTSEAALDNNSATALTLNGTVNAVDRVLHELTLRDSAGNLTSVTVDPFASILPVTAEGTLLGSLLLDQSLVGRDVQVYGIQSGSENRGSLFVVLPVTTTGK
jgi:hypothetical protein